MKKFLLILSGRQTGKSYKLIFEALEQDWVLVCVTHKRALDLMKNRPELKAVGFKEFTEIKDFSEYKGFLFDDVDMCLQMFCGKCKGIGMAVEFNPMCVS